MPEHVERPSLPQCRRLARWTIVFALCALVAVPLYHLLWRQHVKRFQVVRAGALYRVAQPSELGIRYLVQRHAIKTVLNLRLEDDHLRRGVLAVGSPTGDVESRFVEELGIRHMQWPMGREVCWPWVSPWQFEEFFRLFDDPANLPIAVHCVSGRHRTGTISALYRLEYDRWPIERVLTEMYSFSFGAPIPLQEANLRTYVPRPQPSAEEWQALRNAWSDLLSSTPPHDYAEMVRLLRANQQPDAVRQRLSEQLQQSAPFALPLAVRLIDTPDDTLTSAALAAALKCLASASDAVTQVETAASHRPTHVDLLSAATIVADFGSPEDQEQLLTMLRAGVRQANVSPEFQALVAGVSNRYTGNRVPFLAVLLDDTRAMPDSGATPLRYCDMAVAHLSAILDERLLNGASVPSLAEWEQARTQAKAWLAAHPAQIHISRLQPPDVPTKLR